MPTFESFGNPVSHVIMDQNNETAVIANITPDRNTVLDRIQLFFYKQGGLSGATVQLSITTGSKTFTSEVIQLGQVTGNQIGRMRFVFPKKPILTASTGYDLVIIMGNYTPTLGATPSSDVYFSLVRDYPVTMGYNDTVTSRSSSEIACHIIESV